MTRRLYDPSDPRHKAVCQRKACATLPPHPGGRHLDQRDELYDGPGISVDTLPGSVRDSARVILRQAPGVMPELVDMANEINWLRDQVAHLGVQRDQAVRDAMARSESCEHHGEEIKELRKALSAADRLQLRTEGGRIALLGFLHAVDKLLGGSPSLRNITVPELIGALKRAAKKTRAAHDRAWKS
jgi:hypothetical protein